MEPGEGEATREERPTDETEEDETGERDSGERDRRVGTLRRFTKGGGQADAEDGLLEVAVVERMPPTRSPRPSSTGCWGRKRPT